MSRCRLAAVAFIAVGASAGGAAADFDQAIEAAASRVVRLYGAKAGISEGYGSGVLVSGDGLVVTVYSLLLESDHIRAVTADGTSYGAEVIETDAEQQLALLRLKPLPQYDGRGRPAAPTEIEPGTFDYFQPGDSTTLQPGDWVIAAGNPFKVAEGPERVSVTAGVLSARTALDARRKTRDFPYQGEVLVIDAITSNPGAAGGALVDLEGRWVGLVGRLVTSNRTHTHLNYALPVETVTAFIDSVLHPEANAHGGEPGGASPTAEPYHGIKLFEMGYQKRLVYVDRVARDSPARRAGIRRDDLIVSVDGRKVADIESFRKIMAAHQPGDSVELSIIRGERLMTVEVELEEAR